MNSKRKLEDISDGHIYDIEDMVKADTRGCNGCSVCCHDIGDLVVLTPFDVYELVNHLGMSFDTLLIDKLALREEKQILLPYLKMQGDSKACSFLSEEGRCTIHGCRPNICRLFPLGRIYERDNFKYFLQVDNCVEPNLGEVKVREWIGIKDYEQNKAFILEWHNLLKALAFRMKFIHEDSEKEALHNYLLDTFYRLQVNEGEDFYTTFDKRLSSAKKELGIL